MNKPAKQTNTLRALLEDRKDEISKALPAAMDPDKFIRVALTSIQKNPDLQRCTPASIWMSVLEASSLGLQLDGALGHAYLVPYKNQAQMLPGYRGLISLAKRSGDVQDVQARLVYTDEPFEILEGSTPRLAHQPLPPEKRGALMGAYSRITYRNGYVSVEFMWLDQIHAVRDRSKAGDKGPWKTDYEEMVKKTVLRRHLKMADLNTDATRLAVRDEYHEAGVVPAAVHYPTAPQAIPGFELPPAPASDLEVEDADPPVTWEDVPEESGDRIGEVKGKKKPPRGEDLNLTGESEQELELTAHIRELAEALGYPDTKIKKTIAECKTAEAMRAKIKELEELYGDGPGA